MRGHSERLDLLARDAARGLSRRSLMRRAAGVAVAAAFGELSFGGGLPVARADKTRGTCPNTPAAGACPDQNVDLWTQACKKTIPSGVPSTFNGCGPESGLDLPALGHGDFIPDEPLELANFFEACKGHDCCYGMCQSDKAACDQTFLQGMIAACKASVGSTLNLLTPQGAAEYLICLDLASIYYAAVGKTPDGEAAYLSAQQQACLCCNDCPNTKTDPNNCGACGHKCPAGDACCNGECIDLQNNGANCGACGTKCSDQTICIGGQCKCPDGGAVCGPSGACCGGGQACCDFATNGTPDHICYDPSNFFCCATGGPCPNDNGPNVCTDCGCCNDFEYCCGGSTDCQLEPC